MWLRVLLVASHFPAVPSLQALWKGRGFCCPPTSCWSTCDPQGTLICFHSVLSWPWPAGQREGSRKVLFLRTSLSWGHPGIWPATCDTAGHRAWPRLHPRKNTGLLAVQRFIREPSGPAGVYMLDPYSPGVLAVGGGGHSLHAWSLVMSLQEDGPSPWVPGTRALREPPLWQTGLGR